MKKRNEINCQVIFESSILDGSKQKQLYDFIGFEQSDKLVLLDKTNDDSFEQCSFEKHNNQQGETITIVKSRGHNRIFGAYTYVDDANENRQSYLFSYADDNTFEKLNYRAVEDGLAGLHPSLQLLRRENIELTPSSKDHVNGDSTSPKNKVQSKTTANTEGSPDPEVGSADSLGCLYTYLAGESNFKID